MPDLSVGDTIAGCRLESVAGQGGMGVVYRATQLALGRPVAVKAISPRLALDSDFRERFERESQLTASIDHPNVIPVYEAGELGGTLYLIMRWVDGTDLRALLDRVGRLDPQRAVRLLRPVASALAAAHRRGLVHRDIKPANVLIASGEGDDDEHVYLTDFGIARRTEGDGQALTRTGVLVGTVAYTAPERIEGGRGGPASDIYGFGCMLFETLTGHVPFERASDLLVMHAHLTDPVPSARAEAPEVAPQLDAIIANAMAKEPEDRFASAGELATALSAASAEIAQPPEESGRPTEPVGADLTEQPTRIQRLTEEPRRTERPIEEPTPTQPPTQPPTEEPTRIQWPTEEPADTAPRPQPPSVGPRATSRGLWIGAAALVAVIVVAVVLISVTGGANTASSAGTGPAAAQLTAISAGLRPGLSVELGAMPAAVVADPATGSIWASLTAGGSVDRVDGSSGTLQKIRVGGAPKLLAAGVKGVWVSGAGKATLELLDSGTGSPLAQAPLLQPPVALAADSDGSVWAAEPDGTIIHVDTAGHSAPATTGGQPPPTAMAIGEGWLWAVNGQQLTRVDMSGNGPPRPFTTIPAPVAVTINRGIWTASTTGQVTRFNPATLKLSTQHQVASELNAIATGRDGDPFVWTASQASKTVYELADGGDASPVGRARLTEAPTALAVTGSSVWIATAGGRLIQIDF